MLKYSVIIADIMPNVTLIDLFAGAGGLSLGAARAGFTIASAVETDPFSLETHTNNFPSTKHLNADISKLSGKYLLEQSGIRKGDLGGIIGGPPCQGFSVIGKKNSEDPRNELFVHFFRLVKEIQPIFFLAENVPGILNPAHNVLRETAFALIKDAYELLPPIKINASDYCSPTIRTRVFFIGYKPEFFKELSQESFASPKNLKPVRVREALEGLPENIRPEWQTEEEGWRRVEEIEHSYFSERITGLIPEGMGHGPSMERYIVKREVSGCLGTRHSPKLELRYGSLGPGKRDAISKSVRLDPRNFCPTLRAGTGPEKGSFQAVRPIHPTKPRVITPREAARLQGFPDWFVFHRTKWHSFRQIGNSVCPITAELLLKQIYLRLLG